MEKIKEFISKFINKIGETAIGIYIKLAEKKLMVPAAAALTVANIILAACAPVSVVLLVLMVEITVNFCVYQHVKNKISSRIKEYFESIESGLNDVEYENVSI